MSKRFAHFSDAIDYSIQHLLTYGEDVDTGTWQGVPTDPSMVTRELMNLQFEVPLPASTDTEGVLIALDEEIQPSSPWADNHFEERVSRVPSNPGKEYLNWPWWRGQHDLSMAYDDGVKNREFYFTHTYQERFWPKLANREYADPWRYSRPARGIRYEYGDLDDVVNLLLREPFTRQATFPIFFPEDTGAVHGGRIPCTLHYHFLLRGGKLHMWYPIRSCDAVRHFRDDLYLACRLLLWVRDECASKALAEGEDAQADFWYHIAPGTLHFTAYSFHLHKGDAHLVSKQG